MLCRTVKVKHQDQDTWHLSLDLCVGTTLSYFKANLKLVVFWTVKLWKCSKGMLLQPIMESKWYFQPSKTFSCVQLVQGGDDLICIPPLLSLTIWLYSHMLRLLHPDFCLTAFLLILSVPIIFSLIFVEECRISFIPDLPLLAYCTVLPIKNKNPLFKDLKSACAKQDFPDFCPVNRSCMWCSV